MGGGRGRGNGRGRGRERGSERASEDEREGGGEGEREGVEEREGGKDKITKSEIVLSTFHSILLFMVISMQLALSRPNHRRAGKIL